MMVVVSGGSGGTPRCARAACCCELWAETNNSALAGVLGSSLPQRSARVGPDLVPARVEPDLVPARVGPDLVRRCGQGSRPG